MDRVEMNDSKESLGIVNAICLSEPMSNQMSLVACNGTIIMIFDNQDHLHVTMLASTRQGAKVQVP